MNNFQASGPGTAFLPRPALQFLLTSDPFLGTATAGVPDGPFNRELYKLLENDSALANLMMGYLSRTFGVAATAAPDEEDPVPDPLTGAPATPANLAMHTVFYNDFEVVYRYDGTEGEWVEQARMARLYSALAQNYKKVTVPLVDEATNIAIPIPTTNSLGQPFEFTLDDLRNFYVLNLDEESPLISVLPGIVEDEGTLRVVTSSAPTEGSNYQLVMIFENIVGY
jgi:hypothetical protein